MTARTPEDCDRLFGEGINAGDAASVAALYEENGGLVLETGDVATGPAIRGFLDAFVAMKPRLEMNVWRVVRAGDDIAVLYNDWRLTLPGGDGAAVVSDGKAIEIVRRQADGTWKFVLDDPRARG
ncbi:MAG: SgcJ/EcaC family oxidoreductase [Deltaproteobacteria bacterium]|nr:SgcJ/EcaC family oxidoreductase [Deltaproteobacteria bacterium]